MSSTNLAGLIRRCTTLPSLQQAHAAAVAGGALTQPLACLILSSYASLARPDHAHLVFLHHIPSPDLVSVTAFLAHSPRPRAALAALSSLAASPALALDPFAAAAAAAACARSGQLRPGASLHAAVYRRGVHFDTFVGNALVDMYCRNGRPRVARVVFEVMLVKDVVSWRTMVYGYLRCGDVGSACEVFEGMPQRDVIAWTALISGYVQAKEPIRALELFRAMQVEGVARPNTVTMVGVLSGCADVGALDLGRCVHGWIAKAGMDVEIAVLNALIDTYAKSGSVGTARLIFDGMERKDAYTWTTMISAWAIHGDGAGSVSKFSKMVEAGEVPNEVTFLALLSACTHGGLVEEGRKYFTMMREVYKLEPRIEHYGCMVDLLGRAGCLQELEEIMSGMEMEPDGIMLRSLMSSCLLYGDLDLAVKTGREIIRREPADDGVHILLFNIFASRNRWQEALEVRNRMKDYRIKKKPGCSWIEVNGVVHEFLVENGNHFLHEEIKTLLHGITKQF